MDPVRLHAFGCRWSWRLPSRAELRIPSTVYAAACSRDVCARHPLYVQVVCRNSYRFPAAARRPVGCGWRPGLAVRWVRSAARALTYNCVAMYHLKTNKQITCTLDCVVCADLRATYNPSKDDAVALVNTRTKELRYGVYDPVSYTHLTLPTTPYV